jgi:hypothetical protein
MPQPIFKQKLTMRTNIVDAGRANNEVGHVEMQPS